MPREIRSAPLRYGLALASFALILGASFAFERVLPFPIDLTSMIIIAMIVSAWYLGLGPYANNSMSFVLWSTRSLSHSPLFLCSAKGKVYGTGYEWALPN